jgi:translocator protein
MKSIPDKTRSDIISFLTIVVFFQAMGGLMGFITSKGIDGWYQGLVKSPLNPPDYVFGMVWTILYFALAVSFWLLWKKRDVPGVRAALVLFAVHIILNWSWSPVFFTLHAVLPALIIIGLMILTAVILVWRAWPVDRRAAVLLVPYIIWLIFAGHLTYFIFTNN